MLAKNGSDLLWVSALIFGTIAAIILAALAGVDGFDWIAGLLVVFGIPPFVVACLCLVTGLQRRHKWKHGITSSVLSPTEPGSRKARLGFGAVLMGIGGVQVLQSLFAAISASVQMMAVDAAAAGALFLAGLINPLLWAGVGFGICGFWIFRKARREVAA